MARENAINLGLAIGGLVRTNTVGAVGYSIMESRFDKTYRVQIRFKDAEPVEFSYPTHLWHDMLTMLDAYLDPWSII